MMPLRYTTLKMWLNTALGCNHQSICMPQLQSLCSATRDMNQEPSGPQFRVVTTILPLHKHMGVEIPEYSLAHIVIQHDGADQVTVMCSFIYKYISPNVSECFLALNKDVLCLTSNQVSNPFRSRACFIVFFHRIYS